MKSLFKNILLLLNILAFLSAFILTLFNNISREGLVILVIMLNVIFIILFEKNKIKLKIGNNPFGISIILIFLLLIIQVFISLFNYIDFLLPSSLIILYSTFLILLSTFDTFEYLKLYSNFCVYLLFSTIISFTLLHLNIFDKFDNLIPAGSNFLFDGNRIHPNSAVSFPGYLSYIYHPGKMVPFFSEFGTLTSLFHEPHISTLFITPGVFIYNHINIKNINRYWVNIAYIFFMFLSLSATNFTVFLFILIIYIFFELRFMKLRNIIMLFLFLIITIMLIFYSLSFLNEYGLEFVLNKFDDSNRSRLATQSSLEYLLSPSEVWGSGILSYPINKYNDIGFVNFSIYFVFFISSVIGCFRLIINKNTILIGLAILYFLLHSLKFGNAVLVFPIIIFMIYIGQDFYKKQNLDA